MVSEGYQVNYCWIIKLQSGAIIVKLLNFWGNQLISIPELLMSLFLSIPELLMSLFLRLVFWENIPTAEFGMI